MNLYYVLYRASEGDDRKSYVVASSQVNAWAAVQANDAQALSIESMDEMFGSLVIGS